MSIYKKDTLNNVKVAVDSILNQSLKDFELFIIYDGAIKEEIDSWLSTNESIRIIKRNENKGLAHSLNDLLAIVLGKGYKYVARMDADDISMPERFDRQIQYMEEHPECDCLGTWAIEIDSLGNEFFRKQMPITHLECKELFKKRDCMIHPTVMFRRSYFEKAGLYPTDTYFGEDTMMWAKGFAVGCNFANIPEFLFKFRLDENFFKRRRGWKHAKSIFSLRRKVNTMLGFGLKEDCYALMYAIAKMMPTSILNMIYKTLR